jgi:hypothetical protein
LVAHHLLNRSAANPTAADHQPPLGKCGITKTLAHSDALACMRRPARKKGHTPFDLNRMVAYHFAAT